MSASEVHSFVAHVLPGTFDARSGELRSTSCFSLIGPFVTVLCNALQCRGMNFDFGYTIERSDLTYRSRERWEKKFIVVVIVREVGVT